ncbi:MAG: thioredoxin family protein [Elusimicrobiota bacterium]
MRTLALLLLFSLPARAGHVDASLLSARAAAAPGESFAAGLKLRMRDGWHVYWRNPGDAGLAPSLAWRLPRGWNAAPLSWPAPERLEFPPLTNFGYNGEVILPLTLTVPAAARPGTRAALRAHAEWLECREGCEPGEAELTLNIGVAREPLEKAADAAALAAALAGVPRPDAGAAVAAARSGDKVLLRLRGRHPRAEFFPKDPYTFANARSGVSVSPVETELTLKQAPGEALPARVEGVVVRPGFAPAEISVPVSAGGAVARFFFLAFAGGLLLNLMPCVLPVLTFKALGLLNRKDHHPAQVRYEALAYAAGVVLSCETLAVVLLAARRAGATLGWGTQFQSPWVVSSLAALFIFAGLSLFGVFEFGARWMGAGRALTAREGRIGSFFSGVFAMAAGAPCTAPFMGATLGWALTRPAIEVLAVFGALGAGAAAPYACLSSWPALIRLLPRPGSWMVVLKKSLSLPMFATAAWLLWVCWHLLAAVPAPADALWQPWSAQAVERARAAGDTVVVDFTAAWCLSCQVNERTALAAPEVRAALSSPGVSAFRADWTGRDKAIQDELSRYGRNGVPLYVVHPGGGPAVLLPELLTKGLVLDALAAGAKPKP